MSLIPITANYLAQTEFEKGIENARGSLGVIYDEADTLSNKAFSW